MQKQTIYLIIICVVCVTVLGLGGEYFTYQYYASSVAQKTPVQVSNAPPTVSPPALQPVTGSAANAITSFDFTNPLAVGNVDEASHTVTLALPPDSDVTKLSPVITVSQDATVSPASGVTQDFTDPVTYTVTAQNGATQKYVVMVNVASSVGSAGSVEKSVISFSVLGLAAQPSIYIDNDAHTIYVVVPDGTDVTKLKPVIKTSPNTTVFPASGTQEDFTSSVPYVITDMYGGRQTYSVSIVTQSNSG